MPLTETRTGPTPNGGVRSEIRYVNNLIDMKPVDKSVAGAAVIVEFDRSGKEIHFTYGTIGGNNGSE